MSLYVKYLVCYDISNTRTRSKFFDFLKDLGLTPIQKSVFFGDLKTPEVRSLKAAAEKWRLLRLLPVLPLPFES